MLGLYVALSQDQEAEQYDEFQSVLLALTNQPHRSPTLNELHIY